MTVLSLIFPPLIVAVVLTTIYLSIRIGEKKSSRPDHPPPAGGIPGLPARLVRERVIVTLKSGVAFGGVLYEADAHTLTLREAEAFGGKETVPVDGEVIVLFRDVDYVQRP